MLDTWNPKLQVAWSAEEEDILNNAVLLAQSPDRDSYVNNVLAFLHKHSGADVVMLCRRDDPADELEVVQILHQGKMQPPPLFYSLKDTPCIKVRRSGVLYYPAGVQELFPDDRFVRNFGINCYFGAPLIDESNELMGVIALLHHSHLPNHNLVEYVVSILSPALEALLEVPV